MVLVGKRREKEGNVRIVKMGSSTPSAVVEGRDFLSRKRPLRNVRHLALCLTIAGGIVTSSTAAPSLSGEVVGITDGDTLTLLDSSHVQRRIRLGGIDAPEKRQAFGEQSKQQLANMVFGRQVTIEWTKVDRYGRIIGKLMLGDKDVNLTQVSAGMAWHYKKYEKEQSPADRKLYAQAEVQAQASRRGLWRDSNPVAPWDFRRRLNRPGFARHFVAAPLG